MTRDDLTVGVVQVVGRSEPAAVRIAVNQECWLWQLAHRGVVEDLADKLSTRVPVQGSPKLVTSLS